MSLERYMSAQQDVRRWTAERENAVARLELARVKENIAMLISQNQPVEQTGLDRTKLEHVLNFVLHGDLKRLERDLEKDPK